MRRSQRSILLFWLPLAATWLMMGTEATFLAAVVARLPEARFNLAAHGVAFAVAILVEAPVIMLMSAATALVEDAASYRRLRRFGAFLGTGATVLLLLLLAPPVFDLLATRLLQLPPEVARLVRGALWLFLPWPGAIGYRRFVHGVLIRSGRTRLVAVGTVLRLLAMAAAALALAVFTGLPGAWVAATALSTGVIVEAAAARWMARSTVRDLLASPASARGRLGFREIVAFYVPLLFTSLLGLAVQPMLTFFMGRSTEPIDSLAVYPVVNALAFLFRSMGLAWQDAAIALMGREHEHAPELSRFTLGLGLATSLGLAAVVFTPLADVWFRTLSGLSRELTAVALTPARVCVPIPALSVLLSYQRAILMTGRLTRPITTATALEVGAIAALFALFGWGIGLVGATAAFVAFLGGRTLSNLYLLPRSGGMLRGSGAPDTALSV